MYWVYAIKSEQNDRLYIGQTSDITKRLDIHNKGLVRSTRKDAPWKLIAIESFEGRDSARWREHELKRSRGRRLIWVQEHPK